MTEINIVIEPLVKKQPIEIAMTVPGPKGEIGPPGDVSLEQLNDLAGEGRTTETVKDNADKIGILKTEYINDTNRLDFSSLFIKHGFTTVITGDSLSYNRYDFDSEPRANAYDCFPGMLSWSFMLQNAIHTNDPFFKYADEIEFLVKTNYASSVNESAANPYILPFNNRYISMAVNNNVDEISFNIRDFVNQSGKIVIYSTHIPNTSCCSFDVYLDDVFITNIDNNGTVKKYQGFEPLTIEINGVKKTSNKVIFKNFVQTHTTPEAGGRRQFFLQGIGTKYTPVHHTGHGSTTTEFFITNLHERILQYNPDLLLFVIGANDKATMTVQQFKSNLNTIVEQVLTNNPNCKIVLMSQPSSQNVNNPLLESEGYTPDEITKQYVDAMREVSQNHNTYFIDLLKYFQGIDIPIWRFDNIHFNKRGNTILCQKILDILMPQGVYDKNMINSELTFSSSASVTLSNVYTKALLPRKKSGKETIFYDTATSSFKFSNLLDYSFSIVDNVVKVSDSLIRINLNVDALRFLSNVNIQQYGTVTEVILPRISAINRSHIEFYITKKDFTLPNSTDWGRPDFTNSLKFLINY